MYHGLLNVRTKCPRVNQNVFKGLGLERTHMKLSFGKERNENFMQHRTPAVQDRFCLPLNGPGSAQAERCSRVLQNTFSSAKPIKVKATEY